MSADTPPAAPTDTSRRVEAILAAHPARESSLIHVLQDVNAALGWLPLEALKLVARGLGVPLSRVASASTFYKAFALAPGGRTVLRVCMGTACYVRGAREVAGELGARLGVEVGGTTVDRAFTLETVNCLGACALGPVVVSGRTVRGHVETSGIAELLEKARLDAGRPAPAAWTPPGRSKAPPARLRALGDLAAWSREARARRDQGQRRVLVCAGTGCRAAGAEELADAFAGELAARGVAASVELVLKTTGCHGFCEKGPLVVIQPEEMLYVRVGAGDVTEIVEKTLVGGQPVMRLLCADPALRTRALRWSELPFYAGQRRLVLRNAGRIDPGAIEDYVAAGGYAILLAVLQSMQPGDVIDAVTRSGLRGRGGAGFPTGLKWRRCADAPGTPKAIVCNGDEGDPGAYMDRSLFEADPHSILEGMLIAAFAVGASEGHCYIRHEYPLALEQMEHAIAQAREAGLLGKSILGTPVSFDVAITRGGGAFVCGEETALLASIEGFPGRPRPRPPYPVERGLFGMPTVINNVETLATVPVLLAMGADVYRALGTQRSKGTKIFSLVGKVRNTGLVEVPMGTSIRDLVEKIGGGVPRGRRLKAVQVGGPSGGCLPETELDRPVDYEALTEAGAIMGSGGVIVMDDRTCMVDVARYFTEFLEKESCGKCTPCRDGLRELRRLLEGVTVGHAGIGDLELIERLARAIGQGSLCGLGRTAANPVLSTLRHFRHEYVAHIEERRCSAGVCRTLARFVMNERCNGCALCRDVCPVHGIEGRDRAPHVIDQTKCIHCGVCLDSCRRGAIDVVSQRVLDERTRQVVS